MTCLTCGKLIAPGKLACPACTTRKARDAVLSQEKQHLPRVLAGSLEIRLVRPARTGLFHLVLYGNHQETYCGAPVPVSYSATRQWNFYRPALRESLCPACLIQFDILVAELPDAAQDAASPGTTSPGPANAHSAPGGQEDAK
jgi:hypothetical protein